MEWLEGFDLDADGDRWQGGLPKVDPGIQVSMNPIQIRIRRFQRGIVDASPGKDLVEMQIHVRCKPALVRGHVRAEPCRCLHARRDVKLFEHIMDVILDGADFYVQLDGDLFIGQSLVYQPQHFALARRENERLRRRIVAALAQLQLSEERRRHSRRAQELAPMDALDAHDEIVERRVAGNVASEAGFGTRENFAFDLLHAETDDVHITDVLADLTDHGEALPHRHVDDDDIRVCFDCQLERLVDVGGSADHEKLRPVRKAGVNPFPIQPHVCDDHQA